MTTWNSIDGSVIRRVEPDVDVTTFLLSGRTPDGVRVGQRVEIETSRLRKHPWLYGRILDLAVRDLRRWDLV